MRREGAEGSGCTLGCRAGLWCVLGVQCWPMGCSQGTRGQQGPAAATTAGCSGSSGASPWEPAVGGNSRSCWGGALLHPARGDHPTPRSVLLLLKLPLRLVDTGGTQSQLSCTSPGLDPKVAPHVPGQSRAAPQQCPWCGGLTGEGPPCQVTVCHCSDGWGRGRHGMCDGVVAGGRPPCRRVPLFLTPVSVRMVHAALCNADADEGKVPFSARVSGFPLPPCHRHPASVSLCVTINLLPPPPASLSLCLSGCVAAVSPSRDMSPCGVPQSLRGPWAVVARGPCFTPVWLQAQPCSSTKPFRPCLL